MFIRFRKGRPLQIARQAGAAALVAAVALPAEIAAGPPSSLPATRLIEIPEPSAPLVATRAPDEIVPQTEASQAASWGCLDSPELLALHGADGAARLVRLSVVLERSRMLRRRVLEARVAARSAGEPILEAVTTALQQLRPGDTKRADLPAWLPGAVDPLGPTLETLERDAWQQWEELVPPAGSCDDATSPITAGALAVAIAVRQADTVAALTRNHLELLQREGRRLPVDLAQLDELTTTLAALDAAEADWREPLNRIVELVDSAAVERGLDALAWAVAVEEVRGTLASTTGPTATAAHRLLERTVRHAADAAALADPRLIVAHTSLLDLEHTPHDSPRRAAVEQLVRSLNGQLTLLEQLYAARTARKAAFEAAAGPVSDPVHASLLKRSEALWYRLSYVVQVLSSGDGEPRLRAWLWTEVGATRDRLLSVEATLTGFEREALWTTLDTSAFDAAIDEQDRLIATLSDAMREEAAPLAELQAAAVALLEPAERAAARLARTIMEARFDAAEADTRAFLAVAETALLERRTALGEAVALAAELGSDGSSPPAPPFERASLTLREVAGLERLITTRDAAEQAVRDLVTGSPARDRDAEILAVAELLDLPTVVSLASGSVTLAIVSSETAFPVSVSIGPAVQQASWRPADHPPIDDAPGGRHAPAVLTWTGSGTPGPLSGAVPASAPSLPPGFSQRPSGVPPGWAKRQQQARQDLWGTYTKQVKKVQQGGLIGYIASGGLITIGIVGLATVGSGGAILWAGVVAGGINLVKDHVTGGLKAANEAYGPLDPRDRAEIDRYIDNGRWIFDWLTLPIGGGPSKPFQWIGFAGSVGGLTKGAIGGPSPPDDPDLARIRKVDDLIKKALAAAKRCDWPAATDLINQAGFEDPFKTSTLWPRIGNRVVDLTQEWATYGQNARAALISARERAHDEVHGCGAKALTLPEQLKHAYVDETRWACDTKFASDMDAFTALAKELERIRGVLRDAEASCDRIQAASLAGEVVTWTTTTPGRTFSCAPTMNGAADKVLKWTSQPVADPTELLARARAEIEACRLEDAEKLLETPGPPDRCLDPDLRNAVDKARTEVLARLYERQEDTELFDDIEHDVGLAIANCDEEYMRELLSMLAKIEPCVEGAASRTAELSEKLRHALELASEHTLDRLDGLKDLFNQAILAADTACDMQPARTLLDQARSALSELYTSACAAIYGEEINQLVEHGAYVEQRVEARAAVLDRIRTLSYDGEAAFMSGLDNCSRTDLDRAVTLLEQAVAAIDAIPIMSDPSCEAMVRLAGQATQLRDEAEAILGNWAAIEGDLQNARRAAAEGRGIGIDVYCAGVRQKARPAACFAAAIAECEGLVPRTPQPPPSPPSLPPLLPPVPGPTGGSGGSSGTGSGRVQVDDPDPCARDMSWSRARQDFECSCAGYRFDLSLERCVPGGTTASGITQAACNRDYPGTTLGPDPETGRPACLCPSGSAWSGTHNTCLSLDIGLDTPSGRTSCDPTTGKVFIESTGRCECAYGTFDDALGRCVDTTAADIQRAAEAATQAADCEYLYSQIQSYRRSGSSLHQQMAARAEADARSKGCDEARIAEAVARGARPPLVQTGTGRTGGGQAGGSGLAGGGGTGGGVSMDCASCSSYGRWLQENADACHYHGNRLPSICNSDPECVRWNRECQQRRQARQMCVAVCPPGSDAGDDRRESGGGETGGDQQPPDCSHCDTYWEWMEENGGHCHYQGNRLPSICELDPECVHWVKVCNERHREYQECRAICLAGN